MLEKKGGGILEAVQILNNNVVVVCTDRKTPSIVMGRGIGFQLKKGEQVDEQKVEKIFKLKDEHAVDDLTELLKNIPDDFIKTSYSLIDESQRKYNFETESYIYVTLTMHLFSAYEHMREGQKYKNYLPDLHNQYPVAYKIGQDFIAGFRRELGIKFPIGEVKSIALHFINSHGDVSKGSSTFEKVDDSLIEVIKMKLKKEGITRNVENSRDFDRLLIHIKYFVNKLHINKIEKEISEKSKESIRKDFPEAYEIVRRINQIVTKRFDINFSSTEEIYLTIHIERLIER